MNRSPRPRFHRVFAVGLALATLAGCGVEAVSDGALDGGNTDVTGEKNDPPTPTTEPVKVTPPVDLDVKGSDGGPLNLVATTAVADLEAWWAEQYPDAFGSKYVPLKGGLHAYDSDTESGTVPCIDRGVDIEMAMFNAFYCPPEDAVAWDQEQLLPTLADKFGDFTVAVVLAHEWGHMIQASNRADVDGATVTLELQADCFAGAWVRHARDDRPTYFNVDNETLDRALAGILSLRDQPGTSPNSPNAHGSGFDRVGSFQEGYTEGVKACAEYSDATIKPYQFEFLTESDLTNEGNMPLDDDGPAADPGTNLGIKTASVQSLEAYWADTFPEISGGKEWVPIEGREFPENSPLECNGNTVEGYRLYLCSPDKYVAYSTETAEKAYEMGDFAVAALIATQYGLAAQIAMGEDVSKDPITATLRGDCYAGAWGAALIRTEDHEVPSSWVLTLSPGDLDEGVSVLLSYRTDSDRERQGPGFDRISAFRTGVINGAEACATVERSGGD